MSAIFGDSSCVPEQRISTKSASSKSASSSPSTAEISLKDGLPAVNIRPYISILDTRKAVNSLSTALQVGKTTDQYLAFEHVKNGDLAKIDNARTSLGRHTRMSYYADSELLIIKIMPSVKHDAAHRMLSDDLVSKIRAMGVPKREFAPLGSGRFQGHNSSKEADEAYKPLPSRISNRDWPTLIFECGLSDSLSRLRTDAAWWLTQSGGEVKIVLLISIKSTLPLIHLEKWGLSSGHLPIARAVASNPHQSPQIPTCLQQIDIDHNIVNGAPLILEFENIFLRAPNPPETEVVFTAQDLSEWAEFLWETTDTP